MRSMGQLISKTREFRTCSINFSEGQALVVILAFQPLLAGACTGGPGAEFGKCPHRIGS